MEGVPPKFAPFKKLKVALVLEPVPLSIDQNTDITALVPTPFRTGGADLELAGATGAAGAAATTGAAGTEGAIELEMFGKRKKKASEATGAVRVPRQKEAIPEAIARIKATVAKKKEKKVGKDSAYQRYDVSDRVKQDADIALLPEELQVTSKVLLDVEREDPYSLDPPPEVYVPLTRRGFGKFITDKFRPIFPKKGTTQSAAACAAKGEEGSKQVKIYHYQEFIREYLRYESPYRGLLVYHGLGSGKTCSAIAAAEAVFGTRGMKIIVMTPSSLRENFIGEITFCGFKHFRLQNHWSPLSLLPGSTPDPQMVRMFAQNVYGVPDSFFAKRGKGRKQLTQIWVPDFEARPNFDSLSPEEKDEIQTQLKATINNRIKFINYNGITAKDLKSMVCDTPDIFDNSVIVVDEIHNLTRLIQGTLEQPFTKAVPKETLTPDRIPLPQCGQDGKYSRGYLFYRLFMNAKNCKIIGLSGTPLINFPEELGIMMNIMHGPIQTIEFNVAAERDRDVRDYVRDLVTKDDSLDTVFFTTSEGNPTINVMVTRLPEQFTKVLGLEPGDRSAPEILGIKRRDPLEPTLTLQQVWEKFALSLKAEKITVTGTPAMKAQELLPTWDTLFRAAFLQEDGITLKNVQVLQKRVRGLVSYYRGIQGNVMPTVTKDEIVPVPLTDYALKMYNKVRNQEIQIEMKKPKADLNAADAIWAEIGEIAAMKTPSNYRMGSRQVCNFALPEGLTRPRPNSQEEEDVETGKDRDKIVEADIEGKVAGRDEGDTGSVVDEEDEEARAAAGATTKKVIVRGSKEAKEAYRRDIRLVKAKLREMGQTHLLLDGPSERNLEKYSPKFAAMLKRIMALPGSSLVYSTFLEMEGLGIFGICMEANGFVPIEIVAGDDGKLKFSETTAASLAKGPKVKENRYIEFTGVGSKEQRSAAVNLFNARLDKLPPAMEKILKDAKWENNFDGGLCRVFGITAAGAEGLSLKTVRGVHIMEPYWNSVRTQQVKGRAVRICSHVDLPHDQQNVEIYTYCTIIPEEAVIAQAVDKTVERSDRFSAQDAALLGVPIPDKARPAEAGVAQMKFTKAEPLPEPTTPAGAEATTEGPVKFATKLVNEYRGFSTFSPSPIVMAGKRYKTLEHYYQAMKFASDGPWQEAIRVAEDAKKAKQLGKSKEHPIRADWEKVREGVLLEGLRAKFQQNRGLLDLLKSTGERPLIHASVNAYWGEGRTGKGKNRLGKLMEQVREELREYIVPAAIGDQAPPTEVDFGAMESEDEEGAGETAGGGPVSGSGPVLAIEPGVSEETIQVGSNIENKYKSLSNSAMIPITFTSKSGAFTYPSVEHIYQAMKFEGTDPAWQERIRAAKTVEEAKMLAKTPGHNKDPEFDRSTISIVVQALKVKFADKAMADLLASTNGKRLIDKSSDEPELIGELLERVRRDLPDDELPELVEQKNSQEGGAITDVGGKEEDDQSREIIITSDQKVLIISLRKERVLNSLQTIMKTVAVDCALNYEENKDDKNKFACLGLEKSIGSFAYHPNLNRDIQETESAYLLRAAAAAPAAPPAAAPAAAEPPPAPPAEAPPAEAPPTEAPPAEAPPAEAPPAPTKEAKKTKLKSLEHKKSGKSYRFAKKLDEAGVTLGFTLYDITDEYGERAPVGYFKANPKGLPTGDVLPVP